MNSTTRILLRRTYLPTRIGMLVMFCWCLFLTFVDSPVDPGTIWLIPFGGFLVAYLASYFLKVDRSIFPVTDTQLAWIPMVAWPAAVVAGGAGYFLGQILDWQGLIQERALMIAFWTKALSFWPWAVFIGLICWRCLRIMPGAIGGFAFIPLFMMSGKGSEYIRTFQTLMELWPVWTAGSAFLVWEAQYHVSALRKLDHVIAGVGIVQFSTPQMKGPLRSKWPTALADCLVIFTFVGAIAWYIFTEYQKARTSNLFEGNFLGYLHYFFYLLILVLILTHWFQENRASGMTPLRAFVVMVLECTVVGFVLREHLGVQRGARVRCSFCRNWQMAWHAKCPHCGDTQTETVASVATRSTPFFTPHDPGAWLFRVFFPLQLLFLSFMQHFGSIMSYLNR